MAINVKNFPNKIVPTLWADSKYEKFYYKFENDGKKFRGIIDTSEKVSWNKKDRVSFAQSELLKIKANKKDEVDDNIKMKTFFDKFYESFPDTKYKKDRVSHYKRYVDSFIGNKPIVNVRQLHIKESIKYQEEQGLKPRTVKQTIEVLNPVFKSAIANRILQFNPLDGIKIKLPKTKKIVGEASKKLVEIYNAIYEVFSEDPFYLALYLFALQGRRKGEILTLRWEDIIFEHSYYILRNTKNNEEQKMALPQNIKNELLKFKEPIGWVFQSKKTETHLVDIKKSTAKLKKKLNDTYFGIHYLRNVMVSAMAEQGLDSIYLSGALGHNDVNTINKYLTLNYVKGSEMAGNIIERIVKQ